MRIAVLAASALLGMPELAESAQQQPLSTRAAQRASTSSREAYPMRPVRLIVSNTPGSPSDVIARLLGAKLSEAWAHQVVIDIRPGATGLIAAETTARAAPDGYTLWMNMMTQLISTLQAQRHLLAKDFAPVSLVASTPFLIVVGPAVPVKSLAELIAYAKARPGQLTYASSGQWGSSHLCMESFNGMAGLSLLHVPYKGSSLAMNDIVAGHVHVYCPGAPGVPAFAQTGKLRTLGVTYQKPTPLAPGVPPVADTLPGFELLGWYGIEARLQTPKPLIVRISAEIVKALKTPELEEQLNKVGAEAVGSSPAEFGTFLQKETARWYKVLRDGGTQPPSRG
jgi:tripartite-type tricarboxylate transporter receptor subunit TctC